MRESDFIFDLVKLTYYKCCRVNFRRDRSYVDSSDWILIQYAATIALHYEEIKWNPERASNIKPVINKYNQKGIIYPSQIDNWKRFEKNYSNNCY